MPDVATLPLWAQKRIANLEHDVRELRRALAWEPDPERPALYTKHLSTSGEGAVFVNARVPADSVYYPLGIGEVQVMLNRRTHFIEINETTGRVLRVEPAAANAIRLVPA